MYWILHILTCQLGWNLTHYTTSAPRDSARPETFTSQERWCMKSGRGGTELFLRFFTASHHCACFGDETLLVLQGGSWWENASFLKHLQIFPHKAIPYWVGTLVSFKLLCPPVSLPLLWCLQKFYQWDINGHVWALPGGVRGRTPSAGGK